MAYPGSTTYPGATTFPEPLAYAAGILARANLAAYWKLDETSGTTAADSSGNSRSLTHQNGVTVNQAPLLADGTGKSALYDRSNDFSDIAGASWMNFSTAITVEARVKPNAGVLSAGGYIASRWLAGGGVCWWFLGVNSSGKAQAAVWLGGNYPTGTQYTATGATTLAADTEYTLALRWDQSANKVHIFVNGVADGNTTTSGSIPTGGSNIEVGRVAGASGSGLSWGGLIDEVSIALSAVSDAELLASHNAALLTTADAVSFTGTPGQIVAKAHAGSFSTATTAAKSFTGTPGQVITTAHAGTFTAGTKIPQAFTGTAPRLVVQGHAGAFVAGTGFTPYDADGLPGHVVLKGHAGAFSVITDVALDFTGLPGSIVLGAPAGQFGLESDSGDGSFEFEGHADDPVDTEFAEGSGSFTFTGSADTPGDSEDVYGYGSTTFSGVGGALFEVTINPATNRPDYRLLLVNADGSERKQLVDAVMDDRGWPLNGRGAFGFSIPKTSPNAELVRQYDHVQVWVGPTMLSEGWYIIVDPVKDSGSVLQFECSGLRWLLEGPRIGKERPNLIRNGGFEDGYKHWHATWYEGSASEAPPSVEIVSGASALDGRNALLMDAVASVTVRETETAAIFKGNRPYAWDDPQSDGLLAGGADIILDLVEDFADDAVLTIEGFTADVDGGDGLELSQRRADLAKAIILAEYPDMTITAIGRGETIQVASNATPAGQAKNRRIVITGESTRVGHRQASAQWVQYEVDETNRKPVELELDGWINLLDVSGPSKDGWGLYIDRRSVQDGAEIIDVSHTELDPSMFPRDRWTLDGTSIKCPADSEHYWFNIRLYGAAGRTKFDSITLKPNLYVSWYNVFHSTAIGNLVEHAQSTLFHKVDLGIENQCGAFGRRDDFEYPWKDHTKVDDAIEDILSADDAPDFWIATTPSRKIAKTAPRRGRRTGLVFTYGENMSAYTSMVAGDRVATTAYTVSNGTEGGGRAEAVARGAALNGLVLERLETTEPNLHPARLRERAAAMLRYGRTDVLTSITLKSSATAGLLAVGIVPGDTITCQVDDGGLDADGDYRIVNITHSFKWNRFTFDLVPEV